MAADNVQSLHQAATAHLKAGRTQQAVDLLRQIVNTYPNEPRSRFVLGFIAHGVGKLPDAVQWLSEAIRIDPAPAEPYYLLGIIFQQQKQLPAAIDAYRRFLARKPNDGKGLNNLGRAILDSGDVAQAIEILNRAIAVSPQHAGACNNLGDALRTKGDPAAAIAQYRKAIQLDPNCAEAHGNLGALLAQRGERAAGVASMQRAIAINPRLFNAQLNLARTFAAGGPLDAAAQHCRLALEIQPDSANALDVMANVLGLAGLIPQCIATRQRALQLKPDSSSIHSNLLMSLLYQDDIPPEQIFTAHLQWDRKHGSGRTPANRINKSPNTADHRLRVGYLSPNFQTHSVAYFFEPVLNAHDRSAVEIYCYSNVAVPDATTARIRTHADGWRDIAGTPDGIVAKMIEADQIDILVDLAGHTSDNRLPVFARRPAPVQMTWIGYPATTGLTAMDYRLTDAIADPPGISDTLHTEKLLRLEGGCWAYQAPPAPPVGPFPAIANGFVTFGSFNNLPKVTPKVIQTWARILNLVPASRLLLKAAGLGSKLGREYVQTHFARFDINPQRIELINWVPTPGAHLYMYHRVDIALDPFPYNGTTTTCEALWMGVPVITFAGSAHASRVGAALLTHAGVTAWIAQDVEAYIALAVRLAEDLKNLAEVRRGLRDRLRASQLCDAKRLARQLEEIYRQAAGSA